VDGPLRRVVLVNETPPSYGQHYPDPWDGRVVGRSARCDSVPMSKFSRLRNAVSGLVAEDRPHFKRIDVSKARYDDGSWLKDS
jgi:hypothetical protein